MDKNRHGIFSKLIFIVVCAANIVIASITLIIVLRTGDTSPLSYLIPAWAGAMATVAGFYYWKAKAAEKIKLMLSAKNVGLTNDDLDPTRDNTM